MIRLTLPWPPTINHYWKSKAIGRGIVKVYVAQKGRLYRDRVVSQIARMNLEKLEGRLSVHIDAFPPDRRKRDLDNIPKCVLDSLTEAKVWKDDEQIDRLSIERREVVKGGQIDIWIDDREPIG